MRIYKDFINEIKKTGNGDNSREYKFAFIEKIEEVSAALGNRYEFDKCVQKFGRAKVALCVAATITRDKFGRYEDTHTAWAAAVMTMWTNRSDRSVSAATINIHPAILASNSSELRKITTEAA